MLQGIPTERERIMNINKLLLQFFVVALAFVLVPFSATAENQDTLRIEIEEGEAWWGGAVVDGRFMPYGTEKIERDFYANTYGNQVQPLLLSNKGRFVWSEEPFSFTVNDGVIVVECRTKSLEHGKHGSTLRDVYRHVAGRYFPPNGRIPDPLLFTKPQWNTWIELQYDQREDRIRKYADDIIANDFPHGVLMIDDNWQEDYGNWDFHPGRFSDPKSMMSRLHKQGYKVMMWVCPFVSPDSETFRSLRKNDYLIKTAEGQPYICRWWNGYSGLLDFTHPDAMQWFRDRLAYLQTEYGVDGFKLDAGDAEYYRGDLKTHEAAGPNTHSELWAEVGLAFPLNEYRACWKMAGKHLAQRLRDKRHEWEDLRRLIPDAVAQGLVGYAFMCPDMIGGGEVGSFWNHDKLDEELIVRSTQCSALMPMMQFSVAPWRVLGDEKLAICREMAKLHENMGGEILAMAKKAAQDGEPIVRSLEYMYPGNGYAAIKDQFLLGDSILVAPVLEKGVTKRTVVIPEGVWGGDDGSKIKGPATIEIDAPLERLPWYRLEK